MNVAEAVAAHPVEALILIQYYEHSGKRGGVAQVMHAAYAEVLAAPRPDPDERLVAALRASGDIAENLHREFAAVSVAGNSADGLQVVRAALAAALLAAAEAATATELSDLLDDDGSTT